MWQQAALANESRILVGAPEGRQQIHGAADLLVSDRGASSGSRRAVPSAGFGSDFASKWSVLDCGWQAMSDKSARLSA
jgi:hypothetical protein